MERVLHTVLALNFGVLPGLLAPLFPQWLQSASGLVFVQHGAWSWFFTFAGVAAMLWSARNARAGMRWHARAAGERAASPGAERPGAALVHRLLDDRQRVIVLTRDVRQARRLFDDRVWAVDRLDDVPSETRIESVVHLAGAPVLGFPWPPARSCN